MFRHFLPKVLPLQKKVLKWLCKPICLSRDKIGGSKTFGKTFCGLSGSYSSFIVLYSHMAKLLVGNGKTFL
jgi:hypothetical protein